MASVKSLVESQHLKSLPSDYTHFKDQDKSIQPGPQVSIPVIDFSLLTSTSTPPDDRAKAIEELGKACEEWGFFMVVNHGIPETLISPLFHASNEFFDMPEEEKLQLETNDSLYPVMVRSTIGNAADEKVLFWRDYLRFFAHPEFCCPNKPKQLNHLVSEYVQRTRDVVRKLLQGISQSLGLEEDYIEKAMELESSTQIFAANYYPPCPQPELAIGIPPHTDHGLLTTLIQNGVGGLEIQHEGEWFHLTAIPGSIFVNTGDHLEILSNGKYKSVRHRAVLNSSKTRISLVVANGPSPNTIVEPAPPLLLEAPAAYAPMKYMEYVQVQRATRPPQKLLLDRLKLH